MVISLIIAVFLTLFISFLTYLECFHSPAARACDPYARITGEQYTHIHENLHSITRIMDNDKFEAVTIRSYDGLNLHGRYYHTADNMPTKIIFHGYRSHPLRDSAGAYILGKKMGFNILAVDQRAHCKSGGRVITFGICERRDCVSWAEYISRRFPRCPMVLSGLSMGAATVLMASDLALPNEVCAIVADCPYSSPAAIIRKVCKDRHIPAKVAYPFVSLGARIFGGFSLNEASAETAVKNTTIPILLLHGEDDRFVPCEMSRNIHRANKERTQLHTFPEAGHGLCYMTDPIRYERIVTEFLWNIPALRKFMETSDYVKKELSGEIQY